MSQKKNYKVGYKKPPTSSQFKPGQSGNPKGRPKGTKNLKTDLQEELSMKITITENGRPMKLSKQRIMLKALLGKAIQGNIAAANSLYKMIQQSNLNEEEDIAEENLSETDQAIIKEFLKRNSDGE